jgi:DNA polymerase-4
MDAFYASCELAQYPELRGLPMVVGGRRDHEPRVGADGRRVFARLRDYAGRGVLTTASYEARALGVHSGMPTMKAGKLAPDAILLPVNFEIYRRYSKLFKQAVAEVCPSIENVGIDELYADITAMPDDSSTVARRIKDGIRAATGLTCSVGVAPNKLLAKVCSDLNKPDGVTIITMKDVAAVIWPLPVSKINGIGPKSAARLKDLGIESVGELAEFDSEVLQQHFGTRYAFWLTEVALGKDDRHVITSSEPKSISRETTFERDLHPRMDRLRLTPIFSALCHQVADDLSQKGYRARTIGIKLRFEDFATATRDISIPNATDDPALIRKMAGQCLCRVDLNRKLRLLGVRASGLEPTSTSAVHLPLQADLDLLFDGETQVG